MNFTLREEPTLVKLTAFTLFTLAFLAINSLQALFFDAFSSGFSGSDESPHFINSYFFLSLLTNGQFDDPLAYAYNFYASYPKLSIGHWPPAYYTFVAVILGTFSATPQTAMIFNLLISTASTVLVALFVFRAVGWRWALLPGAVYLAMPLYIQATWFFMLDQPIALVCLAAAMCWHAFVQSTRLSAALAYSASAATAILIKGNGWLLGLFPIFHIALGRQWNILRSTYAYLSAVLAMLAVLPWYFVTTRIAADPFRFEFGFGYAIESISFNISVLSQNLGVIGFVLVLSGAFVSFIRTRDESQICRLGVISTAMILSTLTFHAMVPVALNARYMAPALPFAVILAIIAMAILVRTPLFEHRVVLRRLLVGVAVGSLFVPGATFVLNERPQRNLRMADAADLALRDSSPVVIVVDGSSGAEGALIAEVMVRDQTRRAFVVRGSMLFGESDFVGKQYSPLVETEEEVMTALADIGAGFVVVERHPGERYYSHRDLLVGYLNSGISRYRRVGIFKHLNRDGLTEVYEASESVVPNLGAVRNLNVPNRIHGT